MGRRLNDLTGQKFGKLTAIEYLGDTYWLCRCECGRMKKVRGGNLRNGTVRSCGCLTGKMPKFLGCEDNCFSCPYPDCFKPDYLCKSREEIQW